MLHNDRMAEIATVNIVSIGYEGMTADQLIDTLVAADVTCLADVRLNAISRKAGLSKTRLSERLSDVSIVYRHFRSLGNPRDNREPFHSGDLQVGIEKYRVGLSAEAAQESLQELAEIGETGVLAVLCFERDHRSCHRQVVIDEVLRISSERC